MKKEENFYDAIIIGAGPAGLTAGIYIGRAGLKVLILEREVYGGKMTKTYEIENYPSFANIKGVDLTIKMYEHALAFNCEIDMGDVVDIIDGKIKKLVTKNKTYLTYAILVASGTTDRKLGIPGEQKYFSHGVSTCAVCDGALYKEKVVAVVGGGYSATEEALYLTRFIKKLYLIHRSQKFRAPVTILEKVKKNPKIELILDTIAEEITGDGKEANSIKIANVIDGSKRKLDISCLFPYIGQIPNTSFLKNFNVLDENGFLLVNKEFATSIPGLFGAGDVLLKNLRQVANAVGDGANAGQAVVAYLDDCK